MLGGADSGAARAAGSATWRGRVPEQLGNLKPRTPKARTPSLSRRDARAADRVMNLNRGPRAALASCPAAREQPLSLRLGPPTPCQKPTKPLSLDSTDPLADRAWP